MKKTLALILAALMLSSSLVACSETNTPAETTAAETTAVEETTAPVETEPLTETERRALISDDLPEQNFEGRRFVILTLDGRKNNYNTEELNGQALNDALYERNKTVESRFNVKIGTLTYPRYHEANPALQQAIAAGDADMFDLVSFHLIANGANAMAGYYHNLCDVSYIDFDKPWWADTNKEDLTINGKCYVAIGDLALTSSMSVWGYNFNKKIAEDLNIENLYDVVRRGDWTVDYVKELAAVAYNDVNGDGAQNLGDTFGLVSYAGSDTNTYLWAFGNHIMGKDSSGAPRYALNVENFTDVITTIVNLYTGKGVYYGVYPDSTTYKNEFTDGHSLLITAGFSALVTFSGTADFEIGVLPYPKRDKAQEEYMTMLDGGADSTGITILETGKNLDYIGIITEALCAESYKQVHPVYYDIMLKSRYADRPDDAEMIDLIMNGRVFDLGYIYDNWKGCSFWIQDMVAAKNTNVASWIASKGAAVEAYYKNVVELFK